jgi:hypothetical protein
VQITSPIDSSNNEEIKEEITKTNKVNNKTSYEKTETDSPQK